MTRTKQTIKLLISIIGWQLTVIWNFTPYSLASKWSTLALVFLRCTQQSVHGGGEEREPCANSLSSLSSAPNDSWQTTNANPIWAATVAPPPASLALPVQENPAPNPSHPATYTANDPCSKIPPLWRSAHSECSSFKPRQYPALQSHDSREQWFKQSRWRLWHPHAAKHMLICGCYSECHLLELYNQTADWICECMPVI